MHHIVNSLNMQERKPEPTFKIFSACNSIFAWDVGSLSVSSPVSDVLLVVMILVLLSKKKNGGYQKKQGKSDFEL